MKKTLILLSALAGTLGNDMHAQVVYGDSEYSYVQSLYKQQPGYVSHPGNTYGQMAQSAGYRLSGLGDNWFFSAQGGFISFIGEPSSHTDFNGRSKVGLDLSVGKWHSPYFGTRLTYQGLKFADSRRTSQSFSSYRADLLLNVSSFFRPSFDRPARWNISPYIGAGFVRLNRLKRNSLAFSYGVSGSYGLSSRINLSATLGGTSTRQDFDGYGESGRFGDNLLSGSIGLTVRIGHLGWRPQGSPSMQKVENNSGHPTITDLTTFPRNNYDGLKSLRERIAAGHTETTTANGKGSTANFDAPILFFFKRNSTVLVDKQQMVNIKEIAGAVKEYDLRVRVIGAADSKTGSPTHNRELSIKRCKYIAKLLVKAGVPKAKMTGAIHGGIDLYKPYTANRHTCVILYRQNQED